VRIPLDANAYFFEYFDRAATDPVGYLRGHSGYDRFNNVYSTVRAECSRHIPTQNGVKNPVLLGRHMRFGPEPPWLAIWQCTNDTEIGRLRQTSPLRTLANTIEVLRDELWQDRTPDDHAVNHGRAEDNEGTVIYYAEWLTPRESATSTETESEMRTAYIQWMLRNPEDRLRLLLRRHRSDSDVAEGALYFALWELEGLSRLDSHRDAATPASRSSLYATTRLCESGIYRPFGMEQL
jgi:hypothetical protein